MRNARVWRALLGVEKAVVEAVEFEQDDGGVEGDGLLVAHVRVTRAARGRCGICRRRCVRYDAGEGRRRWRALDLGTVQVVLEADASRVRCSEHRVVVAYVPWARHGAGHTLAFDQTVAWLATQLLPVADLADGVVVLDAEEVGVGRPRPLAADGALVGLLPGWSAW